SQACRDCAIRSQCPRQRLETRTSSGIASTGASPPPLVPRCQGWVSERAGPRRVRRRDARLTRRRPTPPVAPSSPAVPGASPLFCDRLTVSSSGTPPASGLPGARSRRKLLRKGGMRLPRRHLEGEVEGGHILARMVLRIG